MRIFKVYAQCVNRVEPIKPITNEEAKELIEEAINEMINNGDLVINVENEDDNNEYCEKFGELISKAEAYFEENGFFMCGDFIVEYSEEMPCRGNIYGYTKDFN